MGWQARWRTMGRAATAGSLAITLAAPQAHPALAAGTHLVQQGETLSEIAEVYGVSTAELATTNGIADDNLIFAGVTLAIPDAAPAPAAGGDIYRVQEGDTLEGIAARFGINFSNLLAANPTIDDPDLIVVGQTLNLPAALDARRGAVRLPDRQVGNLLAEIARQYGFDPALVQALAWQESGWRQGVTSPAGAVGVMQVLPETGAWIATDIVGVPLDIAGSAHDNIVAGVAYLDWLAARSSTTEEMLIYYVQGQGSVARHGVFAETRAYVANVLALRAYITTHGAPPP